MTMRAQGITSNREAVEDEKCPFSEPGAAQVRESKTCDIVPPTENQKKRL